MKSDPRETEERLRKWLDSDQVQRERLCTHLLPLLGDYTNVEPRRPKGGPDGSRDLQALFGGALEVWGAVGFRNSAKDDRKDKQSVVKKFKEDLNDALKQKPGLRGFVFFTNVDLTMGEQEDLKEFARKKGIGHIDLFIRERLRLALDNIEGWGYRLQFLGIPMSPEEQLAFINQFGSRLESLLEQQREELTQQRKNVETKLKRLEFMHDCAKPVLGGSFFVQLNQPYSPGELGHFRILLEVISLYGGEPHPTLWFAGRDDYPIWHHGGQETRLFGSKSIVWSRNPDEKIQNTTVGATGLKTRQIEAWGHLYRKGPFRTLGEFDRTTVSVFITKPLLEKIAYVGFTINKYLLSGAPKEKVVTPEQLGERGRNPMVEWPEPLSGEEQDIGWVELYIRGEDADIPPDPHTPPFLLRRAIPWGVNFDDYTPIRLDETLNEDASSQG